MKINWKFTIVVGVLGAFCTIVMKLLTFINLESNNTAISIISLLISILIILTVTIWSLNRLNKLRPDWVSFEPVGYRFKTWYFFFVLIFLYSYNSWLFDVLKEKLFFINSQVIINALLFTIPYALINILSICTLRFTCEKNSDSRLI